MINKELIIEAFEPLIGFRTGTSALDDPLDADIAQSSQGTFVDGLHPLLSAQILEATALDSAFFVDVRSYDAATTYQKHDLVFYGNKYYYSKVDTNTAHTPAADTAYWKLTTQLSHYLRKKRRDSIVNLINNVRTSAKLADTGKELLQNTLLFYGNAKHEETPNGRFVGLALTLQKQDLTLRIPRVILQFTKAQSLTLYVYHTSKNAAVTSFALNYTEAGRPQTFTLTSELALAYNTGYEAGYYTIGYFESDLIADNKAMYQQGLDLSGGGCQSCDGRNAQAFGTWSPYVMVQPVQVYSTDITNKPVQTWDDSETVEVIGQNWGINLVFSVVCDLTNAYIYNKEVFVSALGTQLKLDLLTTIAHSNRNNQLSDEVRSKAWAELKSEFRPRVELDKEIAALSLDLSNLNSVCMPCKDKGVSFKWGSVF